MDNIKVVKLAALWMGLACGVLSPVASASSSAKGWEEQTWRTGFLASHTRFLVVADMEDEKGQKSRIMSLRGFTNTNVDGVFIAPLGADGQTLDEAFRGYSQSAAGSRLIVGTHIKEFPGADFPVQEWWMEQGPATSFAQWWAMVLAVPQQPRAGRCRFSSHDQAASKTKVWLPRTCTMKDPVTGRDIKLEWSDWRTASEDPSDWQLWVPGKAKVQVEDRRYTIELRNLQMRTPHGPQPHWPLSLVPQAFPPAQPETAGLDEVAVPVEDLDYHQWKAD